MYIIYKLCIKLCLAYEGTLDGNMESQKNTLVKRDKAHSFRSCLALASVA